MNSTNSFYLGCALIAAVSMATIGVLSRYSGLPAEQVTLFRLSIGALFLALLVFLQQKSFHLRPSEIAHAGLAGALLSGFIIFYVQAMNWTMMATAIFFVYLAPIVAALLGRVFYKEILTRVQIAFMLLALLGFFLMQQGLALADVNRGILYALLAMLCYAGFIFINRRSPATADATVYAFWQLLLGSFIVLPICALTGVTWSFSTSQLWLMLLVGFLPGFVALYAAILALKNLTTSVYGTLAYLEPVTVAIFGWVLFDESLTPVQIAGALLIIAAGILQTISHR